MDELKLETLSPYCKNVKRDIVIDFKDYSEIEREGKAIIDTTKEIGVDFSISLMKK